MRKLFLALLLSIIWTSVALAETIDGITYSLNSSTSTATVTGTPSGNVTIPATVSYNNRIYQVTSISGVNSGVTAVEIPEGVTSIGTAFKGKTSLTTVSMPSTVQRIEANAFNGCTSLISINIPEGVTYIGDYAFSGCTVLPNITIPTSVTSMGKQSFAYCKNLKKVIWNAKHCVDFVSKESAPFSFDNTEGYYTYYYYNKYITSIFFGEEVEYIPAYLCCNFTNLTTIVIPDGVKEIGEYAFYGYYNYYYNDHLTSTRNGYMYDSNLATVTLGKNLEAIGAYAFYGRKKLSSITIPDKCTTIGTYAFSKCNLSTITLGKSITNIGNYAFSENNISTINIYAMTPPVIYGGGVFNGIYDYKTVTLNVPARAVDAYNAADVWKSMYVQTMENTYTLSVSSADESKGITTPNGTETYEEGSEVLIYAEAKEGYQFSKWSDGNTENPRKVIITSDINLIAQFEAVSSDPVTVSVPEEVKTAAEQYSVSYTDHNGESIYDVAYVGFDGNDVYIQGLSSYLPDAWIKGVLAGTTVTFAGNQYLGKKSNYDIYLQENNFTMEYDKSNHKFVSSNIIYTYTENLYVDYYVNLVIKKVTEKAAKPAIPTISEIKETQYGDVILFNVPTIDNNGDGLLTTKLSYQLFYEENKVVSPIIFTTAYYPKLTTDMTVIPYGFTDNYDFYTDGIYLNMDHSTWTKIGIQSIYTGGGVENKSEICWFKMGSGDPEEIEVTDISQMDNAIYIEPFTARVGNDVEIKVSLKNAETASAYNFELVLPEGISINVTEENDFDDEVTLSSRNSKHQVTTNKVSDNVYKVAVASMSSKSITGNDGVVLTILAHVSETMREGTYPVQINSPLLVKADGTKPAISATLTTVTVEDYIKGDVDGDGVVDLADAVVIINYCVGKPVNSFVEKAADADGDSVIDLADAVKIINYCVGKVTNLSREMIIKELDPQ